MEQNLDTKGRTGMAKVTIRDIAERVHVSQAAVSLALRGKPGISEQTRTQILQSAQELGYRLPKRTQHSRRGELVVLLVSAEDGPLQPGVLQALASYVISRNGQLRIHTLAQITEIPQLLSGCRLLVTFDTLERKVLDQIAGDVAQILVLDGDYPRRPFWNLRIDYAGAAYSLTEYLSALGHRSFLYINEDLPLQKNLLCFNGFQKRVLELRLPLDSSQIVMDMAGSPNILKHFPDIIRDNNISAIVCTSAACAHQLIRQLGIMGFRVPQDISVAAIVASEHAATAEYGLTYVDLGFSRLAQMTAQLAAAPSDAQHGDDIVPFSPVISGGSVAAPKYNPANKKLAIALYLKDHPTLRVARAGFLNMAQQMGYQAEVAAISDDSEEAYSTICKALAQQGVAGAVIWLNVPAVFRSFRDAGIPAICVHSATRQMPSSGWQACIAADPVKIAETVADFFISKLGTKRGRISVSQSSHNLLEDTIVKELMRQIRTRCPQITVTQDLIFAYHTDESFQAVRRFMEGVPNLIGAFSTSGLAAITWTHAKQALGRDEMVIVGTDYDEDSIELVKRGELDAFVAQPVYEEAQTGVVALDALLRGNSFPSYTALDAPLVTAQNVDKYDRLLQYVKNWYV